MIYRLPEFERRWAFFFDVDGTLLDLADRPDAVVPRPGLVDLLQIITGQLNLPVALISGRAINDLDRLFTPLLLPAAGQHGAERRDATGRLQTIREQGRNFAAAREQLTQFVADRSGLLLEDKGVTLSVHYRHAQHLQGQVEAAVHDVVTGLADRYEVQPGKMVYEMRPRGIDKGSAILAFMQEFPFSGRKPVFIGDDLTDEHGFAVVNQLQGYAIKVGEGHTAAPWRIRDAAAVVAWLAQYVETMGGNFGKP